MRILSSLVDFLKRFGRKLVFRFYVVRDVYPYTPEVTELLGKFNISNSPNTVEIFEIGVFPDVDVYVITKRREIEPEQMPFRYHIHFVENDRDLKRLIKKYYSFVCTIAILAYYPKDAVIVGVPTKEGIKTLVFKMGDLLTFNRDTWRMYLEFVLERDKELHPHYLHIVLKSKVGDIPEITSFLNREVTKEVLAQHFYLLKENF